MQIKYMASKPMHYLSGWRIYCAISINITDNYIVILYIYKITDNYFVNDTC